MPHWGSGEALQCKNPLGGGCGTGGEKSAKVWTKSYIFMTFNHLNNQRYKLLKLTLFFYVPSGKCNWIYIFLLQWRVGGSIYCTVYSRLHRSAFDPLSNTPLPYHVSSKISRKGGENQWPGGLMFEISSKVQQIWYSSSFGS